MNAYIEEKKQRFEASFGTNNIHSADNAWRDYFNVAKDMEQTITRIVNNVRTIFLHDKIFVYTIKGENQSIPVIKSFFENPTVTNFETLAKYHWLHHIKARRDRNQRVWEQIDSLVLGDADFIESEDDNHSEPRAKRMNHSDAEKRRIKEKTQCRCIGLPAGFARCPNVDEPLAYGQLVHEHRLPVAVFGDESDENRWGMCPQCDKIKTMYIDKHVKQQKDNYEFIQSYKLNYTLPTKLVQQILMEIKMDTPESVNLTGTTSHEVAYVA